MNTITPLKKSPGHHGPLIAILMLVATTTVVWTAHQGRKPAPGLHAAVPSPGTTTTRLDPTPPVAEPERTVALDDRAPLVALGTVSFDELRTSHVTVPVHGWLEKKRPSSLRRTVRAGDTLATIYSPEVYLTTTSIVNQLRDFHGQGPLDQDRMRLLRWGMLRPTLARIEAGRAPQAGLPLIARVTGTVVAEATPERPLVEPATGLELFTITDPAYRWVFVDVPEAAAARLAVGTSARLAIEGIARPVTAKVAYVYRHAEDGMRRVRLELYSPRIAIEPGSPVKATLQLDARR